MKSHFRSKIHHPASYRVARYECGLAECERVSVAEKTSHGVFTPSYGYGGWQWQPTAQ